MGFKEIMPKEIKENAIKMIKFDINLCILTKPSNKFITFTL